MSEYTEAPRPKPLKELDHTGTLFESLEQTPHHHTRKLGSRAIRIVAHPHTIQELREHHEEPQDKRETPYDELGGHRSADDERSQFEKIADEAQPWMTDVAIAVDWYGLHELRGEAIQAMTQDDRRVLALHVDGLIERMSAAHRLIGAGAGDVGTHQFLEKRYGKQRTPEEMLAYMKTLEDLRQAIRAQGVIGALHRAEQKLFSLSQRERDKKYKDDVENHGHIRVVYDQHRKARVQRVVKNVQAD